MIQLCILSVGIERPFCKLRKQRFKGISVVFLPLTLSCKLALFMVIS